VSGDDNDGFDVRLKQVLRHLPAPVGVVTSFDPDTHQPVGLAMSAIMPVSLEPSSMAIAVNRSGSSHDAMVRAGQFCINLLGTDQHHHMTPFADPAARGARFAHADWQQLGPIWYLADAPANIFCTICERVAFGTHDLLIGEVFALHATGGQDILGWANGNLGRLFPLPDTES